MTLSEYFNVLNFYIEQEYQELCSELEAGIAMATLVTMDRIALKGFVRGFAIQHTAGEMAEMVRSTTKNAGG